VILTAPGKGDIPNIVAGINNELITPERDHLLGRQLHHQRHRAGAEGPQRPFGIVHGHMETCHSYTNDQNLIDNYHKGTAAAARRR
jgi:glyceraldehyde 3-phosphate dehydrogenase